MGALAIEGAHNYGLRNIQFIEGLACRNEVDFRVMLEGHNPFFFPYLLTLVC